MRGLESALMALQPWPPHPHAENTIRVATYNIRVDHDADDGTGHEWARRRPLATRAIADLDCDIVLLQEPSPPCARELEAALGGAYRVATTACDPRAGAGRGQAHELACGDASSHDSHHSATTTIAKCRSLPRRWTSRWRTS